MTLGVSNQRWDAPKLLKVQGIAVEEVSGSSVKLAVSEQLAEVLGCPAGEYDLPMGTRIGSAELLKVHRDVALAELDGELYYLSSGQNGYPNWSVAWTSSWPANPYQPKQASTPLKRPRSKARVKRNRSSRRRSKANRRRRPRSRRRR